MVSLRTVCKARQSPRGKSLILHSLNSSVREDRLGTNIFSHSEGFENLCGPRWTVSYTPLSPTALGGMHLSTHTCCNELGSAGNPTRGLAGKRHTPPFRETAPGEEKAAFQQRAVSPRHNGVQTQWGECGKGHGLKCCETTWCGNHLSNGITFPWVTSV